MDEMGTREVKAFWMEAGASSVKIIRLTRRPLSRSSSLMISQARSSPSPVGSTSVAMTISSQGPSTWAMVRSKGAASFLSSRSQAMSARSQGMSLGCQDP